ncbi:uncharacterized protein J4E92_009064 [Alternaria infectoria]|uniref:uncharacterized protein n=1 Tax=Alternaria ventricosa TaxID=1187951 RepID=UPI0020C31699|nr:uncharacterized protein J4E93_002792 [Alternaria ventricosa]XP_049212707.1 uncharacterized protein J4E79_003434 [Alternaria viburni]XP_051349501.1 uncharacterized protein J4E92_009064 [Alternaria infectoria]KAI4650436.1 hypothetical protein J4E93_002792 [Alternaria ventricosa]KAI4663934.1 hypothetical protein J4E79_003434 [Alternaria viburni]KAI4917670.1 hypothetical protein J4E92_009064 [Alternaria infectoria]
MASNAAIPTSVSRPRDINYAADETLLPEPVFSGVFHRELDLLTTVDASPSETLLIICEGRRQGIRAVIQEYIDNGRNPTGRAFLLTQRSRTTARGGVFTDTTFQWKPEYRHNLPGSVLAAYFRSPVHTLICIGMLELTTDINMAGWLSSWKQALFPGGSLVAELNWHWQDRTWRDTAKRYAEMASPLGFCLQSVNGFDVSMGGLLQSRVSQSERFRRASTYRRQAARLVRHGRHVQLGQYLESKAKDAETKGVLAQDDFIVQGDRLYGRFVQCVPEPWVDI